MLCQEVKAYWCTQWSMKLSDWQKKTKCKAALVSTLQQRQGPFYFVLSIIFLCLHGMASEYCGWLTDVGLFCQKWMRIIVYILIYLAVHHFTLCLRCALSTWLSHTNWGLVRRHSSRPHSPYPPHYDRMDSRASFADWAPRSAWECSVSHILPTGRVPAPSAEWWRKRSYAMGFSCGACVDLFFLASCSFSSTFNSAFFFRYFWFLSLDLGMGFSSVIMDQLIVLRPLV